MVHRAGLRGTALKMKRATDLFPIPPGKQAPEVLAEICAELQMPFRSNGYRYWKPSREEA
jgi:hypothetical protein